MIIKVLLAIPLLLVPATAFAWGPLGHIYLGSEVFYLCSLLPASICGLIKKYRHDYLYGNLIADMILGKRYLPAKKNSHSWDVALGLNESAKTQPEKAFAFGYMSHLAADTVAHGLYTAGTKNLRHAMLELRADSAIDKSYWFQALAIDRRVQARNDSFLEHALERVIFSFKTNKRIFKTAVALSCLNRERAIRPDRKLLIDGFYEESLDRMVDVLKNGSRSEVTRKDPMGRAVRIFPVK